MKKLFIFAALAAPLFFSCAKEMEKALEQEPEKTPVANVAFKASIESLNSPTKADINASNQLVWAADDKIGVFVDDRSWVDKNQPFTVTAGGSTEGGFAWDYGTFDNTNATAAFFPWQGQGSSFNNVYDECMYFKLPDAYYEYTSGKMLTPLVANITRTGDAYDDIEFKHAGAAVKVTINNLPAGAHSIGMSVTGQQVTGDYKLDLTKFGTEAMVVNGADVSKNSLWLNYEPTDAERPFTFLFPVPELTNPTLTFEIWDENGIKVWQAGAKTKSGDNLGRAEVLEMPALNMTPYKQFDDVSDWSVSGDNNSWGDTPMVTDGEICIAKGVTFASGEKFKIRKDASWTESYGGTFVALATDISGVSDGSDIYVPAGTYDIIFNSSAKTIRVVESVCPYPDAGANVKLYVHPVTAVSNELCFKSDILGTEPWPGTPFPSYEIVAGQKFYTMEFPAYKIWGKTITDLYVVDRDTWSAKDGGCTLTFPGTEMAYYINATKNVDLELLAKRPTEPSITIDGSFSDWDGIAGNSNTNSKENTVLMKSYSDGSDLFVYLKLTVKDGYPVDLSSGRYFRLYFDKDNNKATGATEWYRTGAEAIPDGMENFLVYFNHSGSVENADIQGIGSTWEIKCVNNSGASLEVELKVPISVLGKLAADTADPSDPDSDEIVIFCLGYRGGDYSEFTGSVSGVMIP